MLLLMNRVSPQGPTPPEQPHLGSAPVLVVILAWLLLIAGIGRTFLGLLSFPLSIWSSVITLVLGIALIATSISLRHMKIWALYAYTVVFIAGFSVTIRAVASNMNTVSADVEVLVESLVLLYLWTIRQRFRK